MASSHERRLLALPDDIDDQIEALAEANPKLSITGVVRDIARIILILNLVEQDVLNDKTVVCGGMALRCYHSSRFSIYDTDTSSSVTRLDRQALARALDYTDDDIRIRAASPQEWDYGYKLVTAQPITYTPTFTTLALDDNTFSLTVSHRGLRRPAQWREIVTGYPFSLGIPKETLIPVMHLHEILAEKLASWWLFGHAKHYADIGFIGSLLKLEDRYLDPNVRGDVLALVEEKLEVNAELHDDRVAALSENVRRARLENPSSHIDPKNNWNKVSYLGATQFTLAAAQTAVKAVIIPLLF
jgi:hypothetical protein